jgi:cytoskeletal protein RodZ
MLLEVGPEELGRQLRRARQHLGLSLRDVHAVTAIPLPSLAALEEGNLAQLPSPVYARGYIRSYAEAVRLDGDRLALELWRCLEEEQVAASGGAHVAGSRTRGRSMAPPAQGPVTRPVPRQGARATNGRRPSNLAPLRQPTSPWVPKPSRIRRMAPALERVGVAALLIVLAVGIWDLQRSRPVKKPTAKGPAQVAGIADTRTPTPPEAPASTPSTAPPPSTMSTTAVSDNGSVATYATGRDRFAVMMQATDAPCWLQVRAGAGGPVLFQGILQPGEARPFDATRTLWVRVGNLGHASVLVEGSALVLPNKPTFPYNLLLHT